MVKNFLSAMEQGGVVAPKFLDKEKANYAFGTDWSPYTSEIAESVDTRVPLGLLRDLTDRVLKLPEGFELHAAVSKIMEARRKMAAGAMPLDWGYAETLAYATLLKEGFAVRLSGQDCGRGTFFHRHALVYNAKDGTPYVPLRNLFEGQPNFLVINSVLTEQAVLAFEYGFSTADPKTLVLWEAQFGDFANNAQVVIDQFLSAGEQKWGRLCGLTMLLPHGLEGQGPEHSSARLERYLQLCAQRNWFVCVPTTPAQFFHLLRRQMVGTQRKPLVVMTPKSLLRHRLSVSSLEDLTQSGFREVIGETESLDDKAVTSVVMCSGKVYYDLFEKRQNLKRQDTALIRLEQLYPFPEKALAAELKRYPNAKRFVWCQEEPKNQGAWYPSQHHVWALLPSGAVLEYVGRPLLAAPAVGDPHLHVKQLQEFLNDAFGVPNA